MIVTSSSIAEEDAGHRARNLCVFSHVQKGTPGLMHKGCALQRVPRVSLGALSDITVVLEMRQSIAIHNTSGIPRMKYKIKHFNHYDRHNTKVGLRVR